MARLIASARAPDSPMLNRIVGLGVDRSATEADVDAALAAIGPGVAYYLAVDPAARPTQLAGWLESRGLEPSWGWMAFARGVDDAPSPPTPLRLVVRTSTDRAGYLGLAGTLPEHRGKGARGARRQAEQLLSQHPAPGIP